MITRVHRELGASVHFMFNTSFYRPYNKTVYGEVNCNQMFAFCVLFFYLTAIKLKGKVIVLTVNVGLYESLFAVSTE